MCSSNIPSPQNKMSNCPPQAKTSVRPGLQVYKLEKVTTCLASPTSKPAVPSSNPSECDEFGAWRCATRSSFRAKRGTARTGSPRTCGPFVFGGTCEALPCPQGNQMTNPLLVQKRRSTCEGLDCTSDHLMNHNHTQSTQMLIVDQVSMQQFYGNLGVDLDSRWPTTN